MAKAYMEEAVRGIKTARLSLDDGGYAYCIRQCQEAVERDSLV
jgi:HEPN domain-containing protein